MFWGKEKKKKYANQYLFDTDDKYTTERSKCKLLKIYSTLS